MSAAHTPGPWVVNPIQLNQVCTANGSGVLAYVIPCDLFDETVANARLMALAPELLQMVIELLDSMGHCDSPIENDGRNLVNKAIGGAA